MSSIALALTARRRSSSSPLSRSGSSGTVISWPADGGSAADIGGTGVTDGPGATRPVPIASVAKVMTAYVILRDHPLNGGGPGPDITVQPSEAAEYASQARPGDSLVPVVAGETITERQALEALLLPSADNMAWILARWDAGRQAASVAEMNAAARAASSLGRSGGHHERRRHSGIVATLIRYIVQFRHKRADAPGSLGGGAFLCIHYECTARATVLRQAISDSYGDNLR